MKTVQPFIGTVALVEICEYGLNHGMLLTRSDPNLKDDTTALHLSCISLYNTPVYPETVLGGYEGSNYSDSSLLFVTFAIKKNLSEVELEKAKAWQTAFVKYVQSFEDEDLQLAYVPVDFPPPNKLAFQQRPFWDLV